MRALTIAGHGGLEQILVRDDLPAPSAPRAGEVSVRVRAAALNHLDLFVLHGMPAITLAPDWVVGCDAAGVIAAVGEGVSHVRVGDHVIIDPGLADGSCEWCQRGEEPLCPRYRILGEHVSGLCAEEVVVPGANVYVIPASIAWDAAAAFTLATLTAWRMVVTRAKVQAGDEVLIWGIGGGVAIQALQICRQIGAKVWVTSGSDAKLERARALGADEVLNHREVDVGREVRARTGKRGVSVVIDNVGRETWSKSLTALGRAGRLVTCGATSGPIVETDVRRLFWNQWDIMGSTMGNRREMQTIAGELGAGRLLPVVDSVFAMEDGREAYARLESGEQFGKVVIRVNG